MTDNMTLAAMPSQTLPQKFYSALRLLDRVPHDFVALVSRLSIAAVFWQSGQTKVDGWQVTDNAVYLFETEYKLPFVDPWLAAHLSAFAEHFFPLLLVIGFASRLSALALLGMTLVIEIFVYPDAWPTHGTWAVCFLVIIAGGPGRLSLDYLLARRFGQKANG
jgi:putative oxidoreductase